jgi:DNA-binding NtrC family response regulator
MADARLEGRNVLVVEDDFIVAMDICIRLEETGARILGPVASVNNAMTIIDAGERIDAAVLDVNLKGENSFPVAAALAERKVPFVFTTGYDQSALPESYRKAPRCEKPINMSHMLTTIGNALKG